MNDFKSKLPDLKEISSMTNKLFKSLKTTIEEIIQDYKTKRKEPSSSAEPPKTRAHTSSSGSTEEHATTKAHKNTESEPLKKRSTKKTENSDHEKKDHH